MRGMPLRHHFSCRETIATILADRPEDISAACRGLEQARTEVEEYIRQDPFFQTTFDPVPVRTSSRIIRGMAEAAAAAGVGPMAAVAGAVATAALQAVGQDCRYCVIDNGGHHKGGRSPPGRDAGGKRRGEEAQTGFR